MSSSEHKRQIMNDLGGNAEPLEDAPIPEQEYENFDDFAQRSSHNERRQLFGRSLHPDRIPSSQMEPELLHAIAQIKPQERMMYAFFKHLKQRGLSDRDLERQLGLSTHNPNT